MSIRRYLSKWIPALRVKCVNCDFCVGHKITLKLDGRKIIACLHRGAKFDAAYIERQFGNCGPEGRNYKRR